MTRLTRGFSLGIFLSAVFVTAIITHQGVAVSTTSPEDVQTPNLQLAPVTNNLAFDISIVYRRQGELEFQHLTDDSVLHSGDFYKIMFTPEQTCYVYIFQLDTSGKIYRLFPMKSFHGVTVNNFNPVETGETYYIPAEDKSFILDTHTGVEKIYFLATEKRDPMLELPLKEDDTENQLRIVDQLLSMAQNSKGVSTIVSDPAETEKVIWKEGEQRYSILRRQLENMCDGCVHVLEFEHR